MTDTLAVLNPATGVFLAVDGFAYRAYGPGVFAGALALPAAWSVVRTRQARRGIELASHHVFVAMTICAALELAFVLLLPRRFETPRFED